MFELTISGQFAAAHQLAMVAKKCENLHGHNWKVEVCVRGDRLNDAGVVIDFGILKDYLKEVISRLDHKFLNELPYFETVAPSSENLAVCIADMLQEKVRSSGLAVARVTTWESDSACATYFPR
ncbi:MAG: 6-carboxytetrahydropterin synthase QueD [Desulfosarcina sp.]